MALVGGLPILVQQPSPGSVAGVSDAAAIAIGALLTLVVIYAIVAAQVRKTDRNR